MEKGPNSGSICPMAVELAETLEKFGQSRPLIQHLDRGVRLEEAGHHLVTLSEHRQKLGKGRLVDDKLAGSCKWR